MSGVCSVIIYVQCNSSPNQGKFVCFSSDWKISLVFKEDWLPLYVHTWKVRSWNWARTMHCSLISPSPWSIVVLMCWSGQPYGCTGVMPCGRHSIRWQLFRQLLWDDHQMDDMSHGWKPCRLTTLIINTAVCLHDERQCCCMVVISLDVIQEDCNWCT